MQLPRAILSGKRHISSLPCTVLSHLCSPWGCGLSFPISAMASWVSGCSLRFWVTHGPGPLLTRGRGNLCGFQERRCCLWGRQSQRCPLSGGPALPWALIPARHRDNRVWTPPAKVLAWAIPCGQNPSPWPGEPDSPARLTQDPVEWPGFPEPSVSCFLSYGAFPPIWGGDEAVSCGPAGKHQGLGKGRLCGKGLPGCNLSSCGDTKRDLPQTAGSVGPQSSHPIMPTQPSLTSPRPCWGLSVPWPCTWATVQPPFPLLLHHANHSIPGLRVSPRRGLSAQGAELAISPRKGAGGTAPPPWVRAAGHPRP